jgi:hypothetical protein
MQFWHCVYGWIRGLWSFSFKKPSHATVSLKMPRRVRLGQWSCPPQRPHLHMPKWLSTWSRMWRRRPLRQRRTEAAAREHGPASNREDQGSDKAIRHWQSDKRTSGSISGGNHGRHWQYDSGHSGDRGPNAGGRSTGRSSEWKSRGGYEHHSRGNSNRMAAAAEATLEEAATATRMPPHVKSC